MKKCLMIMILGLISVTAQGERVIAEFSGNNDTMTTEFRVQAPWILDWRLSGNHTGSMGFEITLIDGKTRMHKGRILKTFRAGNGVQLFNESGTFRFRISSGFARWTLKISELSREEAELYTPGKGT